MNRYVVRQFRVGGKTLHCVIDTAHRRWVNLQWSDAADAKRYADRLNLRGTSRVVPLAGVAA